MPSSFSTISVIDSLRSSAVCAERFPVLRQNADRSDSMSEPGCTLGESRKAVPSQTIYLVCNQRKDKRETYSLNKLKLDDNIPINSYVS
jgi:hypothetical protein